MAPENPKSPPGDDQGNENKGPAPRDSSTPPEEGPKPNLTLSWTVTIQVRDDGDKKQAGGGATTHRGASATKEGKGAATSLLNAMVEAMKLLMPSFNQ